MDNAYASPKPPSPTKTRQAAALVASLLLAYLASAVGAIASIDAGAFYRSLDQPNWAPPAWLFGPVWTALYTLMGISAWLVWRNGRFAHENRSAFLLYASQLAVNALWSWLFFQWKLGAVAFFEVVLLFALVAATMTAFRRRSRLAAALLLPYLAWVGFAAALAFAMWQRNPDLL